MALEESGIDLVVEGLNAFEQGLEAASGAVDTLGSIAETVSSAGMNALGAAMDTVAAIASGGLSLALDAAVAGVTFLKDALIGGIAGAMDAEVQIKSLNRVINNLGEDAPITGDQALALADSFAGLAGGSDDAVLAIIELGLKSKKISETEFPGFIQASLDLGAVLGDNTQAAKLLAMAQDDPLAAYNRLERATGVYDSALQEQIKKLQDNGDTAGALALVMGSLADTTGGAALEATQTAAGAWSLFTTSLGEAAETVGTAFLPLITTLTGILNDTLLPVINMIAAGLASDLSTGVTAASGAIGGFIAFIQENLPAIQESFTTAFNSIMVAFNLVASVWRTDLQPALAELFTAIFGQAPTAQQVMDSLLGAIVAGAQAVATWFATTLVPAVKQFSEWITNEFQPRAIELKEWLAVNIPIAIQALADFWTNILQPALAAVWDFVVNTVIPMLSTLAVWLQTNVPIAIQAVSDFITGTLVPAFNTAYAFINDNVIPVLTTLWGFINTSVIPILQDLATIAIEAVRIAFETFVQYYNTSIKPALDALTLIINDNVKPAFDTLAILIKDNVQPVFDTFKVMAVDALTSAMNTLQGAIALAKQWLDDLANTLSNIHIPANLTPGSPTPFEIGLRGAANAAKMLTGEVHDLGKEYDSLGGASLGLGSMGGRSMSIPELLIGRMVVSELVMGALPIASLGGTGGRSIGIMEQNNITISQTNNGSRRDPPSMDDLGALALAMT